MLLDLFYFCRTLGSMKHIVFEVDTRAFGRAVMDFLAEVPREKLPRIISSCMSERGESGDFKLVGTVIVSAGSRPSFFPEKNALLRPSFLHFFRSADPAFRADIAKKAVSLYFPQGAGIPKGEPKNLEKTGVPLKISSLFAGNLGGVDIPFGIAVGVKKKILKALLGQRMTSSRDTKIKAFATVMGGKVKVSLPYEKLGLVVQSSLGSLDHPALLRLDAMLTECIGKEAKLRSK